MKNGLLVYGSVINTQPVYDFFDIRVDLAREYRKGNIYLFDEEERKKAGENGYTFPLIIPGKLREEIVVLARRKYQESYKQIVDSSCDDVSGVYFSDASREDFSKTEAARKANKLPQFYEIIIKSQTECLDAHPETANQNVEQCLVILRKEKERTELNIRGLTLPEYLLFGGCHFSRINEQPDIYHRLWLLEERRISAERCLRAGGNTAIVPNIMSDNFSEFDLTKGARFAVIPHSMVTP